MASLLRGRKWLGALLARALGRLRFPTLFVLTAAVFVLDLAIPDLIPFADEILLGLATVILGRLRVPDAGPPARQR